MDDQLIATLSSLDPADAQYAARFVDALLAAGRTRGATDLHLQPTPKGLELRWRVDGILCPLGAFPPGIAANVVSRLKVLAGLLTYRTDLPQEGHLRTQNADVEVRVCTFPTLHGERAVVRMFPNTLRYHALDELQPPVEILKRLRELLYETSGAILVTGPAGSGKTTTLYAALNELASQTVARSLMSLEDPVEVAVSGVSQSQVNLAAGFDLAAALRSALRQDPQVIMIGEIRDRATAEVAMQASLTGQLILSSFHAGTAVEAIGRLLDMGIEPYVLRSGLLAVVSQRLVRKLCDCAQATNDTAELLGLPVDRARVPVGCAICGGVGYQGRTLLAEMLTLDDDALAQAVLSRADTRALARVAAAGGCIDLWGRALAAVAAGLTSPAEIRRVLGFAKKFNK